MFILPATIGRKASNPIPPARPSSPVRPVTRSKAPDPTTNLVSKPVVMADQSLTEAVQTLQTAVEAMKADQDELRQMFRPMKADQDELRQMFRQFLAGKDTASSSNTATAPPPAPAVAPAPTYAATTATAPKYTRLEFPRFDGREDPSNFKQRCYLRFGPGLRSNALGCLVKLNQGGRPVEVYNDDFQSALLCTSTVRQDQVVDLYTAGLDDWLRIDVEHQRPQNLDVAMNFARSYSRRQLSVPDHQLLANAPFSSFAGGPSRPATQSRPGAHTALAEPSRPGQKATLPVARDIGPDPFAQHSGPFEHEEHEGADFESPEISLHAITGASAIVWDFTALTMTFSYDDKTVTWQGTYGVAAPTRDEEVSTLMALSAPVSPVLDSFRQELTASDAAKGLIGKINDGSAGPNWSLDGQLIRFKVMSLRRPPLPRLLLKNVACMRNAQQILRHVNVSLHDGGALVLTGANGSGKTTFLRMLAGFAKPSAGEILWNGHDITNSGVFEQYKLQLNWLSLKDAVKEKFTVLDNVQWFEVLEGKQGKSLPALELVGLGRLANEKSRMLSMGQRKRLQLARLLAIDRPIWLLDEPSVALDDDGVKLLETIIAEHRKKGGIVIVATHLPITIEDAMHLRLPPRFPRRMTLVDMLDRGGLD
nr:ABC transporter I family member 1 [Ipomoea batatas]